jgi:isopenicillin-N epimerase
LVLPVQQLCRRLAALGVATCIDGPHGITQLPVDMAEIDCDYYAASLHKWTCAPPGSGFLYANPRAQADLEPVDLSWGRLQPHKVEHWNEEFWWRGTRDMTANLTVPVALDFLESIGIDHFRQRTHQLARLGSEMISELAGCRPVVDVDRWHASMVLVQIPNADPFKLRDTLFHQYHIASAIMQWEQRRYLRISCHLYNDESDLEKLAVAVDQSLKSGL